jgi:hypothetical protein
MKNQYPLALTSRLLDQLIHAKVYTKINLCVAYNFMCIQEGDKWKIALCTHYGHFEYVMMPFDPTNAIAILQHLMNDVFHEYLEDFVV